MFKIYFENFFYILKDSKPEQWKRMFVGQEKDRKGRSFFEGLDWIWLRWGLAVFGHFLLGKTWSLCIMGMEWWNFKIVTPVWERKRKIFQCHVSVRNHLLKLFTLKKVMKKFMLEKIITKEDMKTKLTNFSASAILELAIPTYSSPSFFFWASCWSISTDLVSFG